MSDPIATSYFVLRTEDGINLSTTKFPDIAAATDVGVTLAAEGYDLSYVIKVTECPVRRVSVQRTTTTDDLP